MEKNRDNLKMDKKLQQEKNETQNTFRVLDREMSILRDFKSFRKFCEDST